MRSDVENSFQIWSTKGNSAGATARVAPQSDMSPVLMRGEYDHLFLRVLLHHDCADENQDDNNHGKKQQTCIHQKLREKPQPD